MDTQFKEVTKKLLADLPARSREVLIKRYGLGKVAKRETLEAIGQEYHITRERVRQIEAFGLNLVKKSKTYADAQIVFSNLKERMDNFGGIVHEQFFLESLAKDKSTQNHIHFVLVVAEAFTKLKEDDYFHYRWTTDPELALRIHDAIKRLCDAFTAGDLIDEPELLNRFIAELKKIKDLSEDPKVDKFADKWILLTKSLAKNPLGEWGLAVSPNIKMRGIRDYAYLVLRKNKAPLHFADVAKKIKEVFGRNAHPATCHNELIKDKRFVLVGRGLYALTEWGYSRGTVVEVIQKLIKENGPLAKNDVIDKVLKERQVKTNTILVNLQNGKYFKKVSDGRFTIA